MIDRRIDVKLFSMHSIQVSSLAGTHKSSGQEALWNVVLSSYAALTSTATLAPRATPPMTQSLDH